MLRPRDSPRNDARSISLCGLRRDGSAGDTFGADNRSRSSGTVYGGMSSVDLECAPSSCASFFGCSLRYTLRVFCHLANETSRGSSLLNRRWVLERLANEADERDSGSGFSKFPEKSRDTRVPMRPKGHHGSTGYTPRKTRWSTLDEYSSILAPAPRETMDTVLIGKKRITAIVSARLPGPRIRGPLRSAWKPWRTGEPGRREKSEYPGD